MPSERLQKWLASCGYGSRRACEQLVQAGRVKANGEIVPLGTKIDPEQDRVEVDGKPVHPPETGIYLILHKPSGYITTRKDPHAKRTVMELLKGVKGSVYPVGRLDADSEGLLLFTKDGDLTYRLLHPRYKVPKTYRVSLQRVPSEEALERLRQGIELDDGITAPAEVRWVKRSAGQIVLDITLHEGRKRQVKRMFLAVGCPVIRLVRIQFGPLQLGDLAPGKWRYLTAREIAALRKAVNTSTSGVL
jgi:23S rRNA pseudouridine2605 synthase